MLSTGYNCRDLLNIGLMRPIFSPTEYIQIKGRGTRRYTFKIGHTEYEKKNFFLLDFCAVAEYFEEKYDYSCRSKFPAPRQRKEAAAEAGQRRRRPERPVTIGQPQTVADSHRRRAEFPSGKARDTIVSREVIESGPTARRSM